MLCKEVHKQVRHHVLVWAPYQNRSRSLLPADVWKTAVFFTCIDSHLSHGLDENRFYYSRLEGVGRIGSGLWGIHVRYNVLTLDCEWLSLKATDMKLLRERGGDKYGTSSIPGRISIANFLTKLAGVFITSEDPATNDVRLLCAGSTLHARLKGCCGREQHHPLCSCSRGRCPDDHTKMKVFYKAPSPLSS